MNDAGKLDDGVMRAPGMPVARADGEAEAAIKLRRRVEIAHGMDDMVEAAGHNAFLSRHHPRKRMIQ